MVKIIILNLFINIKRILSNILEDPFIFEIDRLYIHNCIIDIINVLSDTLSKFEDIYFNYILKPKLECLSTGQNYSR